MILSDTAKKSLVRSLAEEFGLPEDEGRFLVLELEEALQGDEASLLYRILYIINEAHDADFAMKVFEFAFRQYRYYRETLEDHESQQKVDAFFVTFFKRTFGAKCHEYLRADERDESAINVLQHMSERMNAVLSTQQEMIINLSHAMRTSLNGILGYLNALKNEPPHLQETQLMYLEKTEGESVHLQALVSKILDISKINAGQMELIREPLWLEEVLFESIEKVLPEIRKKKLSFETCGNLFSQQYMGDAQQIMLILTHLFQNAVSYTDYGRIKLCIEVEKSGDDENIIMFTIQDSGRGISKEQIKSVFDPYVRYSAMSDGAGTGLYIVSKLVRKMQGTLNIESKEGEGTSVSFTLRLPVYKGEEVDLSSQHFFFFNDEKVIDEEMFTQLKGFLVDHGARVDIVEDGHGLMNQLLSPSFEAPTCFVLTTKEEYYERYNGLIHYFKSLPKFSNTTFFAQHITNHALVNFFDSSFSHYVPLSTFISLAQTGNEDVPVERVKEQAVRILAVDDIATNLEVLKLFVKLIFPNAVLDMAFGGYEAIGMYKSVDYDIILLDLKMPGLDGYDVIERFKEIKPIPPTFALTADVYKKTFEKISKSGFNGLLEKPLQPNILEETITKALHDISH